MPDTAPQLANPLETFSGVRFRELADLWRIETAGMSAPTQIIANRNYLSVIAMGKAAIPFILRELKGDARLWFPALRVLTGQEDLGKEFAGNFRKMADAWIEWGSKNGYA